MTVGFYSVFLYTTNEFQEVNFSNRICENLCTHLCKDLGITPSARLLFGLRINGTHNWIPEGAELDANIKYDFRLRFKVPELTTLKEIDKTAYNYYFNQVRYDFINSKIPEIEYSKHRRKIVGLAFTDMYKEMVENNRSVEFLEKNYKQFTPKEIVTKHKIFIKYRFATELRQIKNLDHDVYYIKNSYLEQINKMAPNYLAEEYAGVASYSEEDDDVRQTTCPVKVQFSPFHPEQPGLRICYSYKNLWKHITRIEDIYAIIVNESNIKIEMKDLVSGFSFSIPDKAQLNSLVTCIAGYYRLMVKWTVNLCTKFESPSLEMLRQLKCHGPVGGEFSYTKFEKNNNGTGAYIIRQCGKVYDTYYIDIITQNKRPETFKIFHEHNKWHLHTTHSVHAFENLEELAKSIQVQSNVKKYRLAPSTHDKPPLLLLCLPPYQQTANKLLSEFSEIKQILPQLINGEQDLQLYKNTQRQCEGGILTQMRADWKLPGDKKLEVTLKMLRHEKLEYLPEFLKLAHKWATLSSSEIIKLYGITIHQPIAMVMESTKFGPLDEFLRAHPNISKVCLIDAAYSLARALHYLQENGIIHGKIRCSTLHVVKFVPPNLLEVKLGDPGFQKKLTAHDVPWIPQEYHSNLEYAKQDLKAEIYAYATTIWEIFSLGKKPVGHIQAKRSINDFGLEICEIIRDGWSADPDKRFTPQNIFTKLLQAKSKFVRPYNSISNNVSHTNTIGSKNSVLSNETDQTSLTSQGDSYISTDSEDTSTHSMSSSQEDFAPLLLHQDSCMNSGHTILASGSEMSMEPSHSYNSDFLENLQEVLESDVGRVIIQGKIGIGHFGTVYRGQLENEDNTVTTVAVKSFLPAEDPRLEADFIQEVKIMKMLNHPNIVKIIGFVEDPQINIIMEYVKHRSFIMYIHAHRPNLTNRRLLKFAADIALGMEYLRSKNIVHRDLAARNILVDSDECVKISDFGLSQIAGPNGYYLARSTRDIPITYYAPETIESNKYSFESDVWSYGITLFEMFSRGSSPDLIPGKILTQGELYELLKSGERLKRPSECPEDIYENLMMACWRDEPQRRPNFTKLLIEIKQLISEYGESI